MARRPEIDVTVRGAGAFGLACAFACQRRGARVAVIDPFGPGAGASGGTVGALAPHVPENWNAKKAFQLESLLMAEAFWAGVAEAGGIEAGYARTGRIQPIADPSAEPLAEARGAGAAALWQGRAAWRLCDAAATGLPSDWLGGAARVVHDTLSARIAPRRAVAALVAALRADGADVAAEGPDRGIVLHAAGAAGLAELSQALGQPVGQGIKGQSAVLRPALDVTGLPQLFVAGLHIVPHADGSVAIGSTTERDFDAPDTTDAQLDALVETARAACPALRGAAVTDRWAGLRPRARSRAPMLGPWPGRPGHLIANGGFKIGFGMAPKVAEVMADLILEGRDAIPAGFRVEDSLSRRP